MNALDLGKLLGTGKEAEPFEFGEHVVKLYRAAAPKSSAFREAANLAAAERQGLAAPVVIEVRQFDGRWGIVMGRAPRAALRGSHARPCRCGDASRRNGRTAC